MRMENTHFSRQGMDLDIHSEQFSARGSLRYPDPESFPTSLVSPGIMGWYSYVPRMECYHGVVSMQRCDAMP